MGHTGEKRENAWETQWKTKQCKCKTNAWDKDLKKIPTKVQRKYLVNTEKKQGKPRKIQMKYREIKERRLISREIQKK